MEEAGGLERSPSSVNKLVISNCMVFLLCTHIYNFVDMYFYIVDERRAVATVSPPFQTYLVDGCRSPSCFKGVYADTFHKLKQTMNFTFTIEWVKAFGGVKNGQWTGMIGIE